MPRQELAQLFNMSLRGLKGDEEVHHEKIKRQPNDDESRNDCCVFPIVRPEIAHVSVSRCYVFRTKSGACT
jgi:hypothetical protein